MERPLGLRDIYWTFRVYMDGVVRKVNAMVFGRGLWLLGAYGQNWQFSLHWRQTPRKSCTAGDRVWLGVREIGAVS